jgi:hypothetical protein
MIAPSAVTVTQPQRNHRSDPQAKVLSPSSHASGLGLAHLGARGGTVRAVAAVLPMPADGGRALEAGLQARRPRCAASSAWA